MKSNFKTILVPTEFDEHSDIALKQGLQLAKMYNLELILLHVGNFKSSAFSFFSKPQVNKEEYKREAMQKLKKIADDHAQTSGIKIIPMYEEGNTFKIIARFGELFFAKYIIISVPDDDLKYRQNVIDSALEQAKVCKSNIIFLPGKKPIYSLKNVLLPLDLTAESRQKIAVAVDFAKLYGTKVELYSLIDGDEFAVNKIKGQMDAVVKFLVANNVQHNFLMEQGGKSNFDLVDGLLQHASKNTFDAIMIMFNQEKGNKQTHKLLYNSPLPIIAIASRTISSVMKF